MLRKSYAGLTLKGNRSRNKLTQGAGVKQILIRRGGVSIADIPAPGVGAKNILVRVEFSCISAGTELAGVKATALPLYRRAIKQPVLVVRLLKKVQVEGVRRATKALRGELNPGAPTGYSAAGVVVEVGEEVDFFKLGDKVACAGAGIANHAEYIDVPVNLAVKVPEGLGLDLASSVTLGAIALQGVRRTAPSFGENIAVIGLGLLGQLTVQFLKANGCRVIGADLNQERVDLACSLGMDHTAPVDPEQFVRSVELLTGGFGADAVVITAAATSHEIVSQATQACRKKGRVVLVGDVGLHLKREDFYAKEIDFLISTSYGPGRYDPVYEQEGHDYPLAYVRWTENRNMEEYLRALLERKIQIETLIGGVVEVEKAEEAYATLRNTPSALMVLLSYPHKSETLSREILVSSPRTKGARIGVALIGAGDFAMGVHLPNFIKLRKQFHLRSVMSRTGAKAQAAAIRFEAEKATTDFQTILDDDGVDLVCITTRHNLHGVMALAALQAGKHVFVEKPLCLTLKELEDIEAFYAETKNPPLLMTGFNRRFAPPFQRIKEILATRSTPFMLEYRMNAGYLPAGHWVHGAEGGGRNIGEACHVYDLFVALAGPKINNIMSLAVSFSSKQWRANDNFTVSIAFAEGSVCTLLYTALGDTSYPKEQMHIFVDRTILALDNYTSLTVHGGNGKGWSSPHVQKGHMEELESLANALLRGGVWPISLEEQLTVTRISFEVEQQISSRCMS